MKKQYKKPQMQAYNIKLTHMLCVSGDDPLGAPRFVEEDTDE